MFQGDREASAKPQSFRVADAKSASGMWEGERLKMKWEYRPHMP